MPPLPAGSRFPYWRCSRVYARTGGSSRQSQMRKENPNALVISAQVGAPASARSPTIAPAPTAVVRNIPALLIGGCADSCLLLTAGCPVASIARLQPRSCRHEPIGLLLQKTSELFSPLLLRELLSGELFCRSPWRLRSCLADQVMRGTIRRIIAARTIASDISGRRS